MFVGSHTSTLMSESLLGVSVAATRQNSGKSLYGFVRASPRRPPSGGANLPDATTSARVIVAAFNAVAARLSQVAATAGVAQALNETINRNFTGTSVFSPVGRLFQGRRSIRGADVSGCGADHGLHDHVLEVAQEFLIRRLRHRDRDEPFLPVDPEVRAERAAPAEAAFRQERIARHGIDDHSNAETIRLALRPAGERVGCEDRSHQLDQTRAEQATAVQLASVCE